LEDKNQELVRDAQKLSGDDEVPVPFVGEPSFTFTMMVVMRVLMC